MTRNHHIRVFVGPTLVAPLADKFRQAGLDVYCEGTEHLYVRIPEVPECSPSTDLLTALDNAHSTRFGLQQSDLLYVGLRESATA